ncbi:abortive infection family protein [Idiomarina sp.]|uniref:abortive infection family protein n=1 Tax=Idiomarina sp. TaxID=1874361 RepID=UPI002610B26D|nr:abortive infection family protein [Idiomarina sp.]
MDDRRKLVPALAEAAAAVFEKGDWKSLGYKTGAENLIQGHPRLLRSLQWGDPDYEGCAFDVIEHIYDLDEENPTALLSNEKIERWIKSNRPNIYKEFYDESFIEPFRQKTETPCEIVEKALKDAEVLLTNSGPVSAVDRVHTAMHGYLKSVLDNHEIEYKKDAGITDLYKVIRQEVSQIRDLGDQSEELNKMLRSLAAVLDALNPIRNRGSVAHPNDALIGDDEAKFVINIVSTILHYLDAKIYG